MLKFESVWLFSLLGAHAWLRLGSSYCWYLSLLVACRSWETLGWYMDCRGACGYASLKPGRLSCRGSACKWWLHSIEPELINSGGPNLNGSGVPPVIASLIYITQKSPFVRWVKHLVAFSRLYQHAHESLVLCFAGRSTEKHVLISKVVIR